MFRYTQSLDPLAIGKAPNHLTKWGHAETSLHDFLTFSYVDGRAFACGIFDLQTALEPNEYTHRNSRLWVGSELIILDIDDATALDFSNLQEVEFLKTYAAAIIPSSSYTPQNPKAHILFVLDTFITSKADYRRVGEWVARQIPFEVDRATLTPAQAIYGTHFNKPEMSEHVKALDDGLIYWNVEASKILTAPILALDQKTNQDVGLLQRRKEKHNQASEDLKTATVLDALAWVLDAGWGEQDREKRLQTIMAAFAGSNAPAVLNRFLDYSSPRWNVSKQRENLSLWWTTHTPKEDGLTVASLFYEAREKGWLRVSSTELKDFKTFYASEISEWLLSTDLEPVTLINSGTGTGKTRGAIEKLKTLGDEARAIFFSPSIKLCHALSAELTRAGIENTLYIDDSRKTKDAETLRGARVLVTTLQTFAVKAFSTAKRHTPYDLVVMDECDELLSAFVRSGINNRIAHGSHVDFTQARLGIDALIWLFGTAKQLLLLDGTMTELSRFLAFQWSTRPVGVYVNTYKRDKAPVTLFGALQALRDDIVTEVQKGSRIVVATDTRYEASVIHTLLTLTDSVEPENIIRITAETASNPKVNAFFRDVETGAANYQVVIYNSAMGSGVSIVETVPDIVYLIGTYLTPRKFLQLLNRYRVQKEVRAYIQPRETLYSQPVIDRYRELQAVASLEAILTTIERVKRDSVSQIITEAALIAATDEYEQNRSTRDFFTRLLEGDGRDIVFHYTDDFLYEDETKLAKGIVKDLKLEIKKTWRRVEPIRRGDTFPEGLSDEDAARGLLHGFIADLFPNYPREDDDLELANLALKFGRFRGMIKHWLKPEKIIQKTLDELQNARRDSVTFRLYLSRIDLLTQLNLLFNSPFEASDDETLEQRSIIFLSEVQKRENVFNMLSSKKLKHILESKGSLLDKSLLCAKILLKTVGLSYRRSNGKRIKGTEKRIRQTRVSGLDQLQRFVELTGQEFNIDNFNRVEFSKQIDSLRFHAGAFNKLDSQDRKEVLDALNSVDFSMSLRLQHSKIL